MLSSSARSSREEATCWGVVRDVARPGRDAVERALARAAAQGHRVAQRELFRHLAARVHETLHRVLGTNDRMELHLQNAFVEIFRSLASYDTEIDLDTWACAIAASSARRPLEGPAPAALQTNVACVKRRRPVVSPDRPSVHHQPNQ